MPTTLKPDQVQFSSSSFVDPTGRLFRFEGQLYRGIFAERAGLVRDMLASGFVQRAMKEGRLVSTSVADFEVEGFEMVLRHEEVSPVSYPCEWAPEMLKEAAVTMLDLAQESLEIGLSMSDASPWNLLPNPVKPTFIDFGSFRPEAEEAPLMWGAYGQFCKLFLYPLYLYAAGHSTVVADRLRDHLNGVDGELCARLLSSGQKMFRWQVFTRLQLPIVLGKAVNKLKMEEKVQNAPAITEEQLKSNRRNFLRGLRRDVAAIKLPLPTTEWSDYEQGNTSLVDRTGWTLKQTTIAKLLETHRPGSLLDVACNKGWFSLMGSQYCPRVVAFDTDTTSISTLTRQVLAEGQPVLPLVMNILNPTPWSGWKLQQFSSALERFRSDFVMALALIHHLILSQMQDFPRVVQLLASLTRRWLLLEFVPLSDPRSQQILATYRREQFNWYTEDNLRAELERHFTTVESFPSHPEGRTLFFCTL